MKHLKIKIVVLIYILFAGVITSNVYADTIYSTIGPDDSYAATGFAIFHTAKIAVPFTPTSDYFLDSIELIAFAFQSEVNTLYVHLMRDAGGVPSKLQEDIIETLTFFDFPLSRPAALLLSNSELNPLLSSGVQYWLVFSPSPDPPLTGFGLPFNVLGVRGYARLIYHGDWVYDADRLAPTFRVNGTYSLAVPEIEVSPLSYDYGNVKWMGDVQSTFINITNLGTQNLTIEGIYIDGGDSSDFTLTPLASNTITPGSSVDAEVIFAPSYLGYQSDTLVIASNDPDDPIVEIVLGGVGVLSDDPSEQVDTVINYIENAVADGSLVGEGSGNSPEKKIKALTNMLEAFGDLIDDGLVVEGCEQLFSVYIKVDGNDTPPDFVSGPATDELRIVVSELLVMHCDGL